MNDDPKQMRSDLSEISYEVTQKSATERPFSGKLLKEDRDGMYHCIVCNEALFSSETKFDSGSGWPSFYAAVHDEKITLKKDNSHGMKRTEVSCSNCGAHLGHVFPDGPTKETHSASKTGQRFCVNSAALKFDPKSTPEN